MGTGVFQQLGFAPNPCRWCDGTGQIGDVVKSECHECDGTGSGPQWWMVGSSAFEILGGGAKGGGKSYAGIHFMVKGNVDSPHDAGADYSYVLHPRFRGLVTRLNDIDLAQWLKEAEPVYAKLGGRLVGGDFKFPSGATIFTGHLKDNRSYMKYQGAPEIHRWLIEEACQLPDFETYMSVRSCIRSKEPELLRTQVLLTANPEGPGVQWVADRFVRVVGKDGAIIPPRTLIRAPTKIDGREVSTTRIFIPAGVRDNPHLLKDDGYLANLNELPEQRRLALLEGDWGAAVGAFFAGFRARRLGTEPENAVHVVKTPDLKPWWDRAIGLDWGYSHDCAAYWACRDPNTQQVHVYDGFSVNHTPAQKIGVMLAEKSLKDLQDYPGGMIPVYLPHDTYNKTSHSDGAVRSLAEEIFKGAQMVVGPDNISSPALEYLAKRDELLQQQRQESDTAYSDSPHLAQQPTARQVQEELREISRIIRDRKRQGLIFLRALNDPKLGWQLIHSMLRWEAPYDPNRKAAFDRERYHVIAREHGVEAAHAYLREFDEDPRRYPQLQISPDLTKLIRGIQDAQADAKEPEIVTRKHFKGKDNVDALRYLILGIGAESDAEMPVREIRQQAMERYISGNPAILNQGADVTDLIFHEDFLDTELGDQDAERIQVFRTRGRRPRAARSISSRLPV